LTAPSAAGAQSKGPSEAKRNRRSCLRTTVGFVPGLYTCPGHPHPHGICERCNPSQQPSDGDSRVKPGYDGVCSACSTSTARAADIITARAAGIIWTRMHRLAPSPSPLPLPQGAGRNLYSRNRLLQSLVLSFAHHDVNRVACRTLHQGTSERDAPQCPPYRLPSRPRSPRRTRSRPQCRARNAPRPTSYHPPHPAPISCLRLVRSSPRPIPHRTFPSSRPRARQACRHQSPDALNRTRRFLNGRARATLPW
jgi:hypothetical protein